MNEWFYSRGSQQSGPVTFDQLKELARNGGLSATDLVWTSTMKDWQSADQVEGLLNDVAKAQIPAPDPSNPYAAPQSAWDEPAPSAGGGLEEIIPGSEPIDVGACIKRGFELTKRNFGTIILVALTYFGVLIGGVMVISTIISLLMIGISRASGNAQFASAQALVASQVLLQLFSFFLMLGMIRIGLNLSSGKQVSVGQLFGEGRKLLPAIGAAIIFAVMVFIGFMLLIIPGYYIMLRYGQFLHAMVDRNLGVIDSLKYSSSITTNNRLNLFLLILLSVVIVIAGAIALFVGLIFAYPLIWMSWMVAYRWMQYGHRAVEDHPGTQTPVLSGV